MHESSLHSFRQMATGDDLAVMRTFDPVNFQVSRVLMNEASTKFFLHLFLAFLREEDFNAAVTIIVLGPKPGQPFMYNRGNTPLLGSYLGVFTLHCLVPHSHHPA